MRDDLPFLLELHLSVAERLPVRVVCAWCLKEGRPALVREKEPFEDPEETHGVCAVHKAMLKDAGDPSGSNEEMFEGD